MGILPAFWTKKESEAGFATTLIHDLLTKLFNLNTDNTKTDCGFTTSQVFASYRSAVSQPL
jgi:hypothetical protein